MRLLINWLIVFLVFGVFLPGSQLWAQQGKGQEITPVLFLLMDKATEPRPIDAPIIGIDTSIAAYIGETEKGQAYQDRPTKVTSWADFKTKFGRYTSSAPYMAPAVAAFFFNGGTEAYIVKTAGSSDGAVIGIDGGSGARTGLASLLDIDEVSIVAAPGITSPVVTRALITHCELMKDRIAVLDAPEEGYSVPFHTDPVTGYINNLGSLSGSAALYTPWYLTLVEKADGSSTQIFIPPSGAIGGIYARVDKTRGVHTVPANEEILDALSLKINYSADDVSTLTAHNVNTIRTFADRGTLVWGARTTSTNPEQQYVNVSRHLMFLKESIDEGIEWAAWEDNDSILWGRVSQRINDFLHERWRLGALHGAKQVDAYFVQCDNSTMTQDDILNGRLVCLVGVSLLRPAEFTVFRVIQDRK